MCIRDRVNQEIRDGSERPVTVPEFCPSCGNELREDGPFLRCHAGMNCPAQLFGILNISFRERQ